MPESNVHCPSCSVRVPIGTGRFCPACGEPMNAAPRAARVEPSAPLAESPIIDGPIVGGPLAGVPLREPSEPRAPRATANPFLEVRDAPVALPLALAATGAVVGALLWAGIVYATGMEIGYVAWALGGLVGGGCMLGGGRGPLLAAAAALLAFVGIAGGRIYGTSLLVEHQIDAVVSVFTPGGFAAMKRAALTEADDERPAAPFVETAVEDYDEATAAEVAELAEAERQFRERLRDPSFTFEVWRDQQVAAIRSQVSLWDVLKSTFGLIDVLFVLLGLSTAYGIVARAGVTSGR